MLALFVFRGGTRGGGGGFGLIGFETSDIFVLLVQEAVGVLCDVVRVGCSSMHQYPNP